MYLQRFIVDVFFNIQFKPMYDVNKINMFSRSRIFFKQEQLGDHKCHIEEQTSC